MPIYDYKCNKCGKETEQVRSIDDRNSPFKCKCGGKLKRVWSNPHHINATMVNNERWSETMGINPDQIPEAMKLFPGSEYHPETGALKIKNRKHKLFEMKRRGYYD